jgi:hypothetical protein
MMVSTNGHTHQKWVAPWPKKCPSQARVEVAHMTSMQRLVAVCEDVVIAPFSAAKVEELADMAPLDDVMAFLLRHVRCVAGHLDAVQVDPPVAEGAGCRGRCQHCGGEERLATVYPVSDLAGALYYWSVFNAAMAIECMDVFVSAEEGQSRIPRFRECQASFETAIQRCVLLGQADGISH